MLEEMQFGHIDVHNKLKAQWFDKWNREPRWMDTALCLQAQGLQIHCCVGSACDPCDCWIVDEALCVIGAVAKQRNINEKQEGEMKVWKTSSQLIIQSNKKKKTKGKFEDELIVLTRRNGRVYL